MKKILIILMGVLLIYSEPVVAKNKTSNIKIAKSIKKAKKKAKKVVKKKTKNIIKINKGIAVYLPVSTRSIFWLRACSRDSRGRTSVASHTRRMKL